MPQSPMAMLEQMPALVVLERFPVPVLAIADDGSIVFANSAFAELVGHTAESVRSLTFSEVFCSLPAGGSAVSAVRSQADRVVELRHRDNSIVRARMSKSALLRDDDSVALTTFHDLTEQLWVDGL